MSFQVVLRVQPVTTPEAVHGAHIHQIRGHANEQINIDSARSHLNINLFGSGNIEGDVAAMQAQYPKAHAKSCTCAEMILTAHHAWFDKIAPKWRDGQVTPKLQRWIDTNMDWLRNKYPGLASVTLHLDEEAPHIHAMIVPVDTYQISYRRGSKTVTRASYNHVFSDPMQVIQKARAEQNSELTKLGRLQSEYAQALAPLGLKRGIRNSRSKNVTPEEHRQHINQKLPPLPEVKTTVPTPSTIDVMLEKAGIATEHSKARDARNAEKLTRLQAERKQLDTLRQKAIELDRVKRLVEQQKDELLNKDELIQSLRQQVSTLNDELALSKETVDALRKTPLQDIASRLEYDGPLKWKGAIDMVKELGELSYADSVKWLNHEFGQGVAIAAVVDNAVHHTRIATAKPAPRPETAPERAKRLEMTKQLDALQADRYRVTLMDSTNALPAYNYGKGKGADGGELFYDQAALLSLIPALSRENARGYNVYITPLSDTKHYMLVDDMSDSSYNSLLNSGYKPAVVLQSSPASKQAVLVVESNNESKEVLNTVFTEVNTLYGDKRITGQIHPFRLVGFTNRKPKHADPQTGRFPFVRLIDCARILCEQTASLVRAVIASTSLAPAPRKAKAARDVDALLEQISAAPKGDLPDDLANQAQRFYRWIVTRYGPDADLSRADWMLVERLKGQGHAAPVIAQVLAECSPSLSDRHPNVARYVGKTLRNSRP